MSEQTDGLSEVRALVGNLRDVLLHPHSLSEADNAEWLLLAFVSREVARRALDAGLAAVRETFVQLRLRLVHEHDYDDECDCEICDLQRQEEAVFRERLEEEEALARIK